MSRFNTTQKEIVTKIIGQIEGLAFEEGYPLELYLEALGSLYLSKYSWEMEVSAKVFGEETHNNEDIFFRARLKTGAKLLRILLDEAIDEKGCANSERQPSYTMYTRRYYETLKQEKQNE